MLYDIVCDYIVCGIHFGYSKISILRMSNKMCASSVSEVSRIGKNVRQINIPIYV